MNSARDLKAGSSASNASSPQCGHLTPCSWCLDSMAETTGIRFYFHLQQAVDRDDSGRYARTSKDFIVPRSVNPVGFVESKINPNSEDGTDLLVLVFDESAFEPTAERQPDAGDASIPLEKRQVLFMTIGQRGVIAEETLYGIDFQVPAPDWEPTALNMETLAQWTSTFLATFSNGDKEAKFRTRFGKWDYKSQTESFDRDDATLTFNGSSSEKLPLCRWVRRNRTALQGKHADKSPSKSLRLQG